MSDFFDYLEQFPECREGSPCRFSIWDRCKLLGHGNPEGDPCPFLIPPKRKAPKRALEGRAEAGGVPA